MRAALFDVSLYPLAETPTTIERTCWINIAGMRGFPCSDFHYSFMLSSSALARCIPCAREMSALNAARWMSRGILYRSRADTWTIRHSRQLFSFPIGRWVTFGEHQRMLKRSLISNVVAASTERTSKSSRRTDEDVTTKKKKRERGRERERKRTRERGTELSFGKKNLQASLSVKWRVLGY